MTETTSKDHDHWWVHYDKDYLEGSWFTRVRYDCTTPHCTARWRYDNPAAWSWSFKTVSLNTSQQDYCSNLPRAEFTGPNSPWAEIAVNQSVPGGVQDTNDVQWICTFIGLKSRFWWWQRCQWQQLFNIRWPHGTWYSTRGWRGTG